MNRLATFLAALALLGCVSAPPNTIREVAPDTFNIRYSASRHGSKMAPEDQVMFLAAEIALEHNAKYFALVGIGDESPSKPAAPEKAPSSPAPQNVYGIYGVGGTSPQPLTNQVATSRKGVTIKCFATQPEDLIVSNAATVENDIKKKYGLP